MICKRCYLPCSPSLTLSRKILERLLERLRGVFYQFLSLREFAAACGTRPPNTSPSNAAPNRRFIIIRGDQGPSRHGPLLGFDTPVAPHNAAYKRSLMLEQLCSPDIDLGQRPQSSMSAASTVSDSDREILLEDSPKRWTRGGLLRTIIGGGASRSKSSSPGPRGAATPPERPPTSSPEVKKRLGLDGAATPPSVSPPDGAGTALSEGSDAPDRAAPPRPDFRSFYFRFSLELVDRRGPPPAALALQMPRLPQPAHLLLARHLRRRRRRRRRGGQRRRRRCCGRRAARTRRPGSGRRAARGRRRAGRRRTRARRCRCCRRRRRCRRIGQRTAGGRWRSGRCWSASATCSLSGAKPRACPGTGGWRRRCSARMASCA